MFAPSKIKVGARAVALALALATSSFSAHAVLQRVGPVSVAPEIGGFPTWYQDTTGLALEFCAPNTAEVAKGWCLLLPANIPVAPEVFPTNFFIEHFYFDANATLISRGGSRSKIILAHEASFSNGFNVIPGDQVTFSRIRLVFTPIPVTGNYRFIHPYGEEIHPGVAGDRIFFTDDVGILCKGTFTCSLGSRLGPFLLPSLTPGGPEMPPLTATNPTPDTNPADFAGGVFAPTAYPGTGASYISDPARLGPVTGSSLPNFIDSTGASRNHNVFRIEGPPGSGLGIDPVTGGIVDYVETVNFNLAGRIYAGAMPGQATVDRASYTRNAIGLKVDVLATGVPSTVGRIPGQPAAAQVAPTLSFFDAACAGTVDPVTGIITAPFSAPVGAVETQMLSSGNQYWGQTRPAVLPATVCVQNGNARDAAGNLTPVFTPQAVTDEVTVSQASYDPTKGTLTVAATSSDITVPPVLNLTYANILSPLVAGQVVQQSVFAPPSSITVQSSALGSTAYQVSTIYPAGGAQNPPIANGDTFTVLEDSLATSMPVLQNDLNTTPTSVVRLLTLPTKGVVANVVAGVVTGGIPSYKPNLNANGIDQFTYSVTAGVLVSSPATVTVNITPVNDSPVAVNDSFPNAIIGVTLPMNLLANDLDVDGFNDPAFGLIALPGSRAGVTAVSGLTPSLGGTPTGASLTNLVNGVGGAGLNGVVGGVVNFLATVPGTYTFTYKAMDNSPPNVIPGQSNISANTATVTVKAIAPDVIHLTQANWSLKSGNLTVQGSITPAANQTVTFQFLNSAGTVLSTVPAVLSGAAKNGAIALTLKTTLPVGAVTVRATTAAQGLTTFPLTVLP